MGDSLAGTTLRPATPADLPFILRGERSYIREIEPAAEAGWTNAVDRNLQLWVDNLERAAIAEDAGESVGYYLWMPDGPDALLATLHVVPTHRRRGLGRVLLRAWMDDARARGAQRLLLGVHCDNPARMLYEQNGFLRTGTDGDYLNYRAEH
ncbi:GNAT family N-acetyltransferase [Arthrobacter sp. 35W]|uniref:GNAT family N-acetyltransferase n=1 Tax=Arthrobacter sp. 35W TaxID=1132441 RepID=UPI0004278FE8|nr:GNAT family N-acetyltransferase [Arthrobacter sp. 35W]